MITRLRPGAVKHNFFRARASLIEEILDLDPDVAETLDTDAEDWEDLPDTHNANAEEVNDKIELSEASEEGYSESQFTTIVNKFLETMLGTDFEIVGQDFELVVNSNGMYAEVINQKVPTETPVLKALFEGLMVKVMIANLGLEISVRMEFSWTHTNKGRNGHTVAYTYEGAAGKKWVIT